MVSEIDRLLDDMTAWIAALRAAGNFARNASQKNELVLMLQHVDVVMRQAYPNPVNPNPSGSSSKKKCPHCGKDIP